MLPFGGRPLVSGGRPLVLGARPIASGARPLVLGMMTLAFGAMPLVLGAIPIALGAIPLVAGASPIALGAIPTVAGARPLVPIAAGVPPAVTPTVLTPATLTVAAPPAACACVATQNVAMGTASTITRNKSRVRTLFRRCIMRATSEWLSAREARDEHSRALRRALPPNRERRPDYGMSRILPSTLCSSTRFCASPALARGKRLAMGIVSRF